ncbi:thioesterase family protein [Aspergillus undulatus]|uniref:thioesterase family protein n=1 Tax=Aspergillus undulatus TaxID=1810928 RepID=UPI003CCCAD24
MVAPGQVSISCKLLRATSRLCVVKVELDLEPQPAKGQAQEHGWPQSQPNLPSRAGTSQQSQSPSCVAIATFARLDREEGLTQASTPPTLYSPPNRETECVIIDDPLVDAIPVTRKLHWVAPRSKDGLWGHRLGGHEREVWLSFRDGEKISDLLHLALLADMPLQPPATHAAGFYARHAVSTLCQSVEFKKRPGPNTEWVLVRSNSLRIVDGRYDVSVQIMDEDGDILALSNHVVIISDLDRKARM